MMNTKLLSSLLMSTLLFWGCVGSKVSKDEPVKVDDNYTIVIEKSIKDCKEYNILLDEQRTNDFMRNSPEETIAKAVKNKTKTSKKLCQFFAEETSLEKIAQVDKFAAKIMEGCESVGVMLPAKNIHKKVQNLPFFVIRKALALNHTSSLEECELMAKKYK